jgi:transcriptional regulator with XRE-family HTH domain
MAMSKNQEATAARPAQQAAVVKALRAAGVSFTRLAAELGVSTTWVSDVMNGHAGPPVSFREGVARVLAVGVNEVPWVATSAVQPQPAKAHLMMAGVSQRQLARSLGVHRLSVNAALNGRYNPPERLVTELEQLLGLPRELLFRPVDRLRTDGS